MLAVRLRKERKGGKKAQRICVPARKIQVSGHLEVLKIREPAHEIVGNWPSGRALTQHLHLKALELPNHVRGEPLKVQPVRRIWVGGRAIGQIDLVKISVLHTPEDVAPGPVQGRYIAVTLV